MAEEIQKTTLLKRVSIFKDLDEFALHSLAARLETVNYKKDSEIFRQAQDGDSLFIVVSGRVKVVLHNENGKETILTIFKAEDFFGEMSLLDGEPRSAGPPPDGRREGLLKGRGTKRARNPSTRQTGPRALKTSAVNGA